MLRNRVLAASISPWLSAALCLSLCWLFTAVAQAHPAVAAYAIVNIRANGRVQVSVHHDALAFALNDTSRSIGDQAMLDLLAGPHEELERTMNEGRDRFDHLFSLRADDTPVRAHVTIAPSAGSVLEYREAAIGPVLPIKMDIVTEADLPPGTTRIALKFPEVMGDIIITVAPPKSEAIVGIAQAGEWSREFTLPAPVPAPAPVQPETPTPSTPAPTPAAAASEPGPSSEPIAPAPAPSAGVAMDFISLGIFHILPDGAYFSAIAERFGADHPLADLGDLIPDGADHILFVLGLFFLTPRRTPSATDIEPKSVPAAHAGLGIKSLLFQITAFTIAHSVTIALAASGKVTIASSIVEPLIAASIAAVAIENVIARRVHSWRLAVVFAFGLIHGLGFAASFKDAIGAERAPLVPIMFFNIGVELGQIAVVALALAVLGPFKHRSWYRARIAIPASMVIAAIGTLWFIQRVFS